MFGPGDRGLDGEYVEQCSDSGAAFGICAESVGGALEPVSWDPPSPANATALTTETKATGAPLVRPARQPRQARLNLLR